MKPQKPRSLTPTHLLIFLALLLVASGAWFLRDGLSNNSQANQEPQKASQLTAKLTRQTMQENLDGKALILADSRFPIESQLGTAGVITRQPPVAGSKLSSGDVLTTINERPLFIFSGSLPAYRDLAPGARGQDVAQIQTALRALGYPISDQKGHYGKDTAYAIYRFYLNSGYYPPGDTDQSDDPEAPYTTALPLAEYTTLDAESFYLESPCGQLGKAPTSPLCWVNDGSYRAYFEPDSNTPGTSLEEGQETLLDLPGTQAQGKLAQPLSQEESDQLRGQQKDENKPRLYPLNLAAETNLPGPGHYPAQVILGQSQPEALTAPEAALIQERGSTWLELPANSQRVQVTLGYCYQGYCELLDPAPELTEGTEVLLANHQESRN